MTMIRLEYRNGQFIPLDDLPPLEEGFIIEALLKQELPTQTEIQLMLDQTRGIWADVEEDIEGFLEESRKIWDEEWRNRFDSL